MLTDGQSLPKLLTSVEDVLGAIRQRTMKLRHLGAAESPFSIAERGGRHAGFLRNARKMSDSQMVRARTNLQKQIEIHEAKIDNPREFIDTWDTMDPRRQAGLIRHWYKEIDDFADQQSILGALL